METKLSGTVMPVLHISLQPGDTIVATTGQLSWMTESIRLRTTTAAAGSSGFFGGLKRALGGDGLFMTEYTAPDVPGVLAFAARLPGEVVPVTVEPGRGYMVHRGGFLCGTSGVALGTGFQRKLGVGLFGGQGFLLEHLTGAGTAWLELGGEIIASELAPGETLLIHPGHVGAFDDAVTFDVQLIKGIRNALFGGDGLFLLRLTGPGRVWLQTLTIPNLAHALEPYLPQPASSDSTASSASASSSGDSSSSWATGGSWSDSGGGTWSDSSSGT